jgi:beta-galactosidase
LPWNRIRICFYKYPRKINPIMEEKTNMEKSIKMDKLTLGVCYYPEHWPESLWEDDLKRMLDHGIEIVRIAEFAWNKFEPQEGSFTFEFFDRFLELAYKNGMKVIFCTPTATPPAWLTHKYPEVLNAKEDGTLFRHGMRRHYNYNSPIYREFTTRIVDRIAAHYSPHPAIIGWQIDNELNCETNEFYSDSDHKAFRAYLKEKFKTLEALNEAMGTTFWNQTYTSWDELHLTRTTIHKANNPHLSLEEKRFFSKSTISYCKLQSDIIKKYVQIGQFITTNGLFGHLDSHEMTDKALDFITYDSYPNFAFDLGTDPKKPGNLNDRNFGWSLTKARSISPNFGIMEQQSGPGGWDSRMKQPAPKPGQMRLWTFQSIAHGADFISYFRWRTCWIGTEIYWHGLNDYSNLPNRRLEELKNVYADMKKMQAVAGSIYQAKIAFVKDYDNEWDGEQDQWHGPLDSFSCNGWFSAAQLTHTPMDFLYLRNSEAKKTTLEDLQKYELLIYPHATILTEETANLLKSYVSHGGKLIMGARTGYKDEFGRCPMRPMPGFAGEICGVVVSDYTYIGTVDEMEYAVWDGEEVEAPDFNDILEATGSGKVLATFKGNYYDGAPALVANEIGKGTAYYFGGGFSTKTAEAFLSKLGFANPFKHLIELPAEAELAVRSKNGKDYIFVLNYMPHSIQIDLKETMTDLLSGKTLSGKCEIKKYGVMVFEK